jgi:hypothetical protein
MNIYSYEPPDSDFLHLDTSEFPIEDCCNKILESVKLLGK